MKDFPKNLSGGAHVMVEEADNITSPSTGHGRWLDVPEPGSA